MNPKFHFTLEPHWRTPLSFWVHVPVAGSTTDYAPPAPVAAGHRGFAVLHVEVAGVDLQFSSRAQLDHFIEVMETKPRPTSRQLSGQRGAPVGPNGHWLSRLPAKLKSPREQERLVGILRSVRAQLAPYGDAWHLAPQVLEQRDRAY